MYSISETGFYPPKVDQSHILYFSDEKSIKSLEGTYVLVASYKCNLLRLYKPEAKETIVFLAFFVNNSI